MKYEDMLERPRIAFAKLAQHLLLAPTEKQLDDAIEQSSFKRLQAQEIEKGFSEKPKNSGKFFRAGKSGQWKDLLSQKQINRILDDHGEQMARYGYA